MSVSPPRVNTGRFFWANDPFNEQATGWYYQAREGIQGPFQSRGDAQAHLDQLVSNHPWVREVVYPEASPPNIW